MRILAWAEADRAGRGFARRGADEYRPQRCRRLERLGECDRCAHDRIARLNVPGDRAGDHGPGRDADPAREHHAVPLVQRDVLAFDRLLHRHGADHRAFRIVVACLRHAEHGEHRVPDVFVHHATAAVDLAREGGEV